MPATGQAVHDPAELAERLRSYVERTKGDGVAVKPAHRVKFDWPPHPVSYSYHVLATDWSSAATLEAHGEAFPIEVAKTPYGVFGRSNELWLEARGKTMEEMLLNLRKCAEPLFKRQLIIAKTLERDGRFQGHIRDLDPEDLLKLLYCEDRDASNDARTEIETHASSHIFADSLIFILEDRSHPHRRAAQWCVLDLLEDLPSFCTLPAEEEAAVKAMRDLIWDAEDDYARTIYKAGVVLGGHLPEKHGGPVLLECLEAPSRVGRRSAIHGLFHVVEWVPALRDEVVAALRRHVGTETDPQLREFASLMARDIESNDYDHIEEPVFPEEL